MPLGPTTCFTVPLYPQLKGLIIGKVDMVIAILLNREFIGVDLNQRICEIYFEEVQLNYLRFILPSFGCSTKAETEKLMCTKTVLTKNDIIEYLQD